MKHQTFESYLQGVFMQGYHGDKEHFEDAYEAWLLDTDVTMIIQHAENWGKVITF